MSRWLSQVNNLLEKLDGTVETAVEEQLVRAEEEGLIAGQGKDAVDSILAKRGLDVSADTLSDNDAGGEVDNAEDEMVEFSAGDEAVSKSEKGEEEETERDSPDEPVSEPSSGPPPTTIPQDAGLDHGEEVSEPQADPFPSDASQIAEEDSILQEGKPETLSMEEENVNVDHSPADANEQMNDAADETMESRVKVRSSEPKEDTAAIVIESKPEKRSPPPPPPPPPKPPKQPVAKASPAVPSASRVVSEKEYKKALADARAAQKEARTLRRHVVSLNTELESAESEIEAQRSELERAGDRMSKDRQRAKEEKERLIKQHKEEVKLMQQQQDKAVTDWKVRHDKVVSDSRVELKELEARRMQEGGDWNKEMEGALQRESESRQKISLLQDEKETLLSQLESTQTQQEATERRLDSLQQTADNAFLREREAEDKLDAALSLHARQLSQRQARESELERTIADLGTALVAARNKAQCNESLNGGDANVASSSVMNYKEEWAKCQDELDAVRAQLESEKQRCQTMKKELKDMSKERTQDLAAARTKQLQHDMKVADLSSQISHLQKTMSRKDSVEESSTAAMGEDKVQELMELSEQVVRQQERLGSSKTEISTLRSRLQAALNRADKAEAAQVAAENALEGYDIESGDNGKSRGLRRRGRRKKPESVRSALMLSGSQNGNIERVGKAIDVLDTFSMQTGKFLRYNPFARGGFILYLLLLHGWTFIVIMFHAHNSDHLHAGVHGPHALMLPPDSMVQQHRQQLANQLKVPADRPLNSKTENIIALAGKNTSETALQDSTNDVEGTELLVKEQAMGAQDQLATD